MIPRIIRRTVRLNEPQKVEALTGPLYLLEDDAHTFEITVLQDGTPAALSGIVTARFIRADGTTLLIPGSISGNVVTITLLANCYTVNGRIGMVVFISGSGVTNAIYAVSGTVYRSTTETIVDPEGIVPSIEGFEGLISDCETATAAATAAAAFLPNIVAPQYSALSTYAVGDHVVQNGYLYRCKAAITTAEAFTDSHWEKIALADTVGNLSAKGKKQDFEYNKLLNPHIYGEGDAVTAAANTGVTVLDNIFTESGKTTTFTVTLDSAQSTTGYVSLYNGDGTVIRNMENIAIGETELTFTSSIGIEYGYLLVQFGSANVKVHAEYGYAGDDAIAVLNDSLDKTDSDLLDISREIAHDFYTDIVVGSIIGTTGQTDSSTTRCRTNDYIGIDDFLFCDIQKHSGYKYFVYLYNSSKTFIKRIPSNWTDGYISNLSIRKESGTVAYIKFVFKKSNDGTITDTDRNNMKDVVCIGSVTGWIGSIQDTQNSMMDTQEMLISDVTALDGILISGTYDDLELASIDASGQDASGDSRLRTADYISMDSFLNCDITGTIYQMYAFLYDDQKSFLSRIPSSWTNMAVSRSDLFAVNPAVAYVRLLFRLPGDETMGTADINALSALISVKVPPESVTKYGALEDKVDAAQNDIAAVQDEVLSICYENIVQGSISSSGAVSAGTSRCRTADYISIDEFLMVDMSKHTTYKIYAFLYAQDKSLVQRIPSSWSNVSYTRAQILTAYPTTKFVKILYSLSSGGDITPDDIKALQSTVYITPKFLQTSETKQNKSRFDEQFNYIAYSHLTGGAPINSDQHFLDCAKADFTALKGDLQPTSDNGLILCHDAGYTFDSSGKIISYNSSNSTAINTLTVAQCEALTFAEQFNGTDCHPISFETFIRTCKKYGKIAFITIRDTSVANVVAPEVMRILRKYRMVDRAIVNSFTAQSLREIRCLDRTIMLSLVMAYHTAPTTDTVDTVISLGNCLLNLFDAPVSSGDTLDAALTRIDSVLAYAYANNVIVYDAQTRNADTDTLMKHGIMGTHMYDKPDYLA